jgi:uncharacterized protein YecE (DUF72 family)
MLQKNAIPIEVKVGTCGYSYEDWRNCFYPPELPKNNMLEFYCQYFQTVEVNSSYYAMPTRSTMQRLAEKTPPGFEFIVKTNQETTHSRKEPESAARQLLEAIKPMIELQKLKGLLAQFPFSFKNNEANRRYLAEMRKLFGELPLFVEFRQAGWGNPQVAGFLQENNLGYVNVDEPRLNGLLPPQDVATTGVGYIRLHGRNEKDWWQGQGSSRYDYEYKEQELKEWITNLSRILKKTNQTYIYFNNHPKGQAIKNARQMMEIIKDQLQLAV